MAQVIVYTNENGNVSVCVPTGELPIEDVLAKDCPDHGIIVDASSLPHEDDDFFNAWRLVDGTVTVDINVAKDIQTARLNAFAREAVSQRSMNTAIGIENDITDAEFVASLAAKRLEINAATSTAELRLISL